MPFHVITAAAVITPDDAVSSTSVAAPVNTCDPGVSCATSVRVVPST
jgi:hypothetical protein